jgi:hypothetical protein
MFPAIRVTVKMHDSEDKDAIRLLEIEDPVGETRCQRIAAKRGSL